MASYAYEHELSHILRASSERAWSYSYWQSFHLCNPMLRKLRTKEITIYGINKVPSTQPPCIFGSDFSIRTVKIFETENIAAASVQPDCIIQSIVEDTWEHTNVSMNVNDTSIQKEAVLVENWNDVREQVKTADGNTSTRDEKRDLQIADDDEEYREDSTSLITDFQLMLHDHLGRIHVTKHGIVLETSAQRAIYTASFWTRLKT